jgi:hypothetical protein
MKVEVTCANCGSGTIPIERMTLFRVEGQFPTRYLWECICGRVNNKILPSRAEVGMVKAVGTVYYLPPQPVSDAPPISELDMRVFHNLLDISDIAGRAERESAQ